LISNCLPTYIPLFSYALYLQHWYSSF
jgi:hypothetical protein